MSSMPSFKVYFVPKKHSPVKVLHLAMQTYLNFFNAVASNDTKNDLPKRSYENAKAIKYTDDTFLGKKGQTFSAERFLSMFYALGFYAHFFSMYMQDAVQNHVSSDRAEYSFICTLKLMFNISDFIHENHISEVVTPVKNVLQDCPIPKRLINDLVATMHGQRVAQ